MGIIDFLENHMLACQWKKLGIECMGCGFQRSVIYVLKGDFINAFLTYPAIYTLGLMLTFLLLHLRFNYGKGHLILKWLFILNISIIVVNYLIKII